MKLGLWALKNLLKKIKAKRRSAKKRIEKTPKIRELEMGWYRGKPRELRPATLFREPKGVGYIQSTKSDVSVIHTHPEVCIPSAHDLYNFFLYRVPETNIRNMHVVAVDKKGNVTGYFSVLVTAQFIGSLKAEQPDARTQRLRDFIAKMTVGAVSGSFKEKWLGEFEYRFLQQLQKKKLIKFRTTPMLGYRFEKGIFVKKEK